MVTSALLALLLCLFASAQSGTLDPTFNNSGTPGYVTTDVVVGGYDYAQAIAVHSDGRVVVATYNVNNYLTVVRYTSSGTLDATFGTGGIVTLQHAPGEDAQAFAVSVLNNNKILVAGYSWGSTKDFALLRLNEDGTPDASFGTNGWAITQVGSDADEARSIAVQSDGKIVVTGISYNGSDNDIALVRYNSDGTLDNSFGTAGIVTTNINNDDLPESVALQSDGKIVIGGSSNATNVGADFAVVRYNSDGSLDNTFGTGGITTVDIGFGGAGSTDLAHSVAIQSDGKIILAGQTALSTGGNDDVAIVRLTSSGVLDSGFDGDGIQMYNYGPVNTDDEAHSVIVQSDGKILLSGSTDGTSSSFALLLLRYNPDGSLDPTFGPSANGIATADITSSNDIGYTMALHGSRIYVAGSTADPALRKQVILAAFSNNYTTLPLSLLQFWAETQTNKVQLHWQTTSEENVKEFIVERSNDGKTFATIAHVFPTGNSNSINDYAYTDQLPLAANNFYRLFIQDEDGKYKYSKVVSVRFAKEVSMNLLVYPSPVKDNLQIQLPSGLNGNIDLQIIDINGRIVKRNSIASNGNSLTTSFDVSSLQKGVYIIKVLAGGTSVANKSFIKE